MRCNSKTLMVTPHLKVAIDSLQLLVNRNTEWIWIDQICINQNDKTSQHRLSGTDYPILIGMKIIKRRVA